MGQPVPKEPRWIVEIDDDEWEKSTPAERRRILEDAWNESKDKQSYFWKIAAAIAIAALLVALSL